MRCKIAPTMITDKMIVTSVPPFLLNFIISLPIKYDTHLSFTRRHNDQDNPPPEAGATKRGTSKGAQAVGGRAAPCWPAVDALEVPFAAPPANFEQSRCCPSFVFGPILRLLSCYSPRRHCVVSDFGELRVSWSFSAGYPEWCYEPLRCRISARPD